MGCRHSSAIQVPLIQSQRWDFRLALCLLPGVASVVVSFFLSMYYNVINAWGFWYLFHSFQVSQPLARAGSKRVEDSGMLTRWGVG